VKHVRKSKYAPSLHEQLRPFFIRLASEKMDYAILSLPRRNKPGGGMYIRDMTMFMLLLLSAGRLNEYGKY